MVALAAGIQSAAAAELVMFEDPACPWCRRWHAEIGPGYANTEEGRQAPLRRVDIKDQEKAGVVLKRPVTATPTFVLVEDGREVGRLVGYPGSDFFYDLLGEVLALLPKRQRGASFSRRPCRPQRVPEPCECDIGWGSTGESRPACT